MPNFKIVPITPFHIQGYNQAVGMVAKERKYLAFLEGPTMAMSKSFVEENIAGNWPHMVAEVDGKVVGWCDISACGRDVNKHAGSLGIGIVEGFRNMGIGYTLMESALSKAQEKGLTRIELTVREHNLNAISLYKKFGFEMEGLHKNAIRIDGKYENYISMALLFE